MCAALHPQQGLVVDAEDAARFDAALALALDYRGDVTLTCRDGRCIVGYLFDRQPAAPERAARVRLLPSDGSARITVSETEIARIEFSGRDTATGKSFETWMRKYVEKKLAGERAGIESEPLDAAGA